MMKQIEELQQFSKTHILRVDDGEGGEPIEVVEEVKLIQMVAILSPI